MSRPRWWRRSSVPPAWPRVAEGWIWPRRLDPDVEQASPAGVTALGTVGGGVAGAVDDHGTVQLAGRPWTLEWWIGAEDRWHRSASEVGVRQQRLGPGPVVESAMRVPGGDVVARVGGVETDGPVVAVEIENRSAVPVALAVVLRPLELARPGRISGIRVDSSSVWVDDEPALVLDRQPANVVVGDAADDLAERVGATPDLRRGVVEHACPADMATVAVVMPLAHTAVVRLVMASADPQVLATIPPLAAVADGWAPHLTGAELVLPDGMEQAEADLAEAVLAARSMPAWPFADRPVTIDDEVRVLEALVRCGHPAADEADRWLAARGVPARHVGAAAMAVARAALAGDAGWFDDYLGWAVDNIARGLDRDDADARRAAPALCALLRRSGQPEAADQVARAWQPPPPRPVGLEPLGVVDPVAGATRLLARMATTVAERPDGVDLLSDVPPAWWGRPVDVRDVPTAHGRVAFSVRWHGARPALLWERERWSAGDEWTVRCPGLDPTWASADDRGEALLAPPGADGGDGPRPLA